MSDTVPAVILEGPRSVIVRSFPRPDVDDHSALLRVELVGICGTDVKTYLGSMPYPLPLLLGHEIVGCIEEAGPEFLAATGVAVGQRVYIAARVSCQVCPACQAGDPRACVEPRGYGTWTSADEPPHLWGGMARFMHLAPGTVVRPIPAGISPAAALMASTVVANGIDWVVRVGGMRRGDTLIVQGCGPQGLGAVVAGLAHGAREVIVTGLPRDGRRLELAARAGAVPVIVGEDDLSEVVRRRTGGRLADVVINVTGSAASVTESIRVVRDRGTIALAGLAGEGVEASIPIDEIVWREISLRGCFSKAREATAKAIRLLATDPDLCDLLEAFVTDVIPLEEVGPLLEALAGQPTGTGDDPPGPVKVAVDPWLGAER